MHKGRRKLAEGFAVWGDVLVRLLQRKNQQDLNREREIFILRNQLT